mmetsp:Transcript_6771/g.25306  ORF Transcript_6771/g.25306 Transcript_6771/m.25306 type:complete len:542 (-) Transcript_6771:163-1788(-)|eukprot:CAMPEP_0117443984 /NCGR_PEP_ID=MMETSP0759-20121206/4993_1 /TAXON_ID=63605 /ORGANISM="Percolomonas cosmopolitus, Strain WS" /LENGTH=541 /DNA_ID=CAMNT_0005236009 /DNA_START=227 /DNA_END=1852 /DNA_ORIENTATION=+
MSNTDSHESTHKSTTGDKEKAPSKYTRLEEADLLEMLHEGNGECILVKPDTELEYEHLKELCEQQDATITQMQDTNFILVRQFKTGHYIDMRVAFAGNVDAGKSSLVGVLCNGKLDDGRGSARATVFVHRHEAQTGRTSSVAHHIIGFDAAANIVNYPDTFHGGLNDSNLMHSKKHQDTTGGSGKKIVKSLVQQQNWKEIVEKSAKIASLEDLPGHEAYLRTTVSSMVGHSTQCSSVCVVVGANMGVLRMTKEHISLALVLKIPMFFVVTKIDICPPNILKETLTTINKILKLPGVRKIPFIVKNREDVVKCVLNMKTGRVVPIILMSSVTGENVDLVRMLFNLLPVKRNNEALMHEPTEYVIDATYFVSGIGTVVSGIMHQGRVRVGDTLKLGPDGNGVFRDVTVKGIHCKRVAVEEAVAGEQATFALKKERRSNIRKGQVMVAKELAKCCWEFEASVHVLYHSTTIKVGYQPVVHCMCTRQAAKIVSMDAEELRTRDKATVKFRFMFRPVYMKEGEVLILREGVCKAVGSVSKVYLEES